MNRCLIFYISAMCILSTACKKTSSIKEESITLKTYPYGDPDPVARPQNTFYPYFRFDGYSAEGKDSTWKAVVMENPYVKVVVMPDIGGKIWGAIEKSTSEEFIYYNKSAKFRDIAMRGPWTSGGIEANFGIIGHVPTTSAPVDYCVRTNDDGSVSCFIGALELVTRTWWQVEINLPADKAYFTTKTTWHNASPVQQPYYHWMNAGYAASDDLEFYFTGQYYIGHDGDVHAWPKNENGRMMSEYAQNDFGSYKSYHVMGELNNFYAAYYHNRNFGSVHYAPYDEKLGMKIWIWGLSRQGMIWEDLLTDTNGQYVELQSGRLYNQAASGSIMTPFKQFAFEPYATDSWTEYWYPVKDTKGVTEADEYGVLSLTKETNDSYSLHFCPVQKIDADLTITSQGKEIFKKRLNLKPMETWSETNIAAKDLSLEDLKITLGNGLSEYSGSKPLSRPRETAADFDWNSTYGLYLRGQQEMDRKSDKNAETYLLRCLEKDPFFVPAVNAIATLRFKQGRYVEVLWHMRKALSVNAYDPDANMLYGLANSRLGNDVDAKDGFSVAALTASHRAAAYTCLAREYAKDRNWKRVLHYTQQSLRSDGRNTDAVQLQAVAYRLTGQTDKARSIVGRLLKSAPLNQFARYEEYKNGGSKQMFTSGIRNELPYQTYIEMAIWYQELGCSDEALELFALADNPLADYGASYLLHLSGKESESDALLKKAEQASPALVFPYRPEMLPALERAVQKSNNPVNKYYLGILYMALGRDDDGKGQLEECGNDITYAPFYLARAQFREGNAVLADLKKAESIEKSWRTGVALIQYYENANQKEEMFRYATEYKQLYPANYVIGLKYAASLLNMGQYQTCIDYLTGLTVLPNECAYDGRALYRDAWLFLAMQSIAAKDYDKALQQIEGSKQWPENLGVGKPYDEDIDLRSENYLTAWCLLRKGDKAKADEATNNVIAGKGANANELLSALALKRNGNGKQADERMATFVRINDNKSVAAWCESVYKNNGSTAGIKPVMQTSAQNAAWEGGPGKDYELAIVERIMQVCK